MKPSKFRLLVINNTVMRGAICYSDNPERKNITVAVTKSYIYIMLSDTKEYIWNPYEIGADGKLYMKYLNAEFREVYEQYPDFIRVLQDLIQHPNDKEPI